MFTRKIRKELIFDTILFLFGIGSICLFYRNNVILASLLLIAWLFGLKFWHTKRDVYIFVTGAIIGPFGEIIAIRAGAWHYANPTILGIPIWLPLAWGLAVITIFRFVELIAEIDNKSKTRRSGKKRSPSRTC